jgi:glycerophosphoryl diester phosphodiesterase
MPKLGLARLLPHLGRLGRASRWKRTRGRPRVWAHRGDSANAPENTMRAFELAVAAGADGIELDVRFDGDGNVVVFHDSELERLTGRPGTMETTSAAERAKLRVQGEPVTPAARTRSWSPRSIRSCSSRCTATCRRSASPTSSPTNRTSRCVAAGSAR